MRATQNLSSMQVGSVAGCLWMIGPGGKRDAASCNEIVPLEVEHLPFLQQVVNSTYKNIWTRDRRKHHPETWHNYLSTSNIQRPVMKCYSSGTVSIVDFRLLNTHALVALKQSECIVIVNCFKPIHTFKQHKNAKQG